MTSPPAAAHPRRTASRQRTVTATGPLHRLMRAGRWPAGGMARLVWVVVALAVALLGLVLLSALYGMAYEWVGQAWAGHAAAPVEGPPQLRENRWSATYSPGKGHPGVPMQLDLLDARSTLHVPALARSGWVGMKGQPDNPLSDAFLRPDGFPILELTWPSVHLPDPGWCSEASTTRAPEDACPVLSMRLRSEPLGDADRALLAARSSLPDQTSLPPEQRTVSTWTAFTTRTGQDGLPHWAGWVCDLDHLIEQNNDLNAWWGQDESQFAMDLADATCHTPPTRLTRHWPALAYHWPALGRHEVHPVLWECPARRGCEARFVHANRLVRLELPGGVIDGQAQGAGAASAQPAHLHLRPRLLQAAWQTLEDAARAATLPAEQATASAASQWQSAMQQETAWCATLAKYVARHDARQTAASSPGQFQAELARKRDERSQIMGTVVSAHPRGPCARGFHRVMRHLALAPDSAAPPFAPEGVPPQVLASAQELATAEQRLTQRLSDPLWHAVDALLLQAPPATRTLARLRWNSTSVRLQQAPLEALALHDALGAQALAQLDPVELIRLRMQLAWALDRLARTPSAQTPPTAALANRVPELFWQASQQWLGMQGDLSATLDPVDGVALLVHTASHLRALTSGAASADADSAKGGVESPSLVVGQAQQRLETVIQGMERLARQLAVKPDTPPLFKATQLGTLAVHAAWHAHYLAGAATPSTTQARSAWRTWLADWANWQATQLPTLPHGTNLLAGVALHRDAALSGKAIHPDCPGGHLLGCRMSVP